MKAVIVGALAAMAAFGPVAASDGAETYKARQHLGQATGYMAVCAYLVPTEALAMEVEKRVGQAALTDGDTVYAHEQRLIIAGADAYLENGLAGYCAKGIAQFGPGGSKANGWLSMNPTVLPWKVERLVAFSRDNLGRYSGRRSEPSSAGDNGGSQLIGEIFAYAEFCDMLEVNSGELDSWAIAIGADLSADGAREKAISAAERVIPKLQSRTASDVCAEALRLFGQQGTLANGILVLR